MKLGFPSTYLDQAYTVIQSSLQQGKLGGASDAEKIESCVSGLANVTDKLRIVLDTGMGALRTAAVKPSLKPLMQGFSSTSHDINDAEFAEYEANDPFVQGLILNLDTLLKTFKAGLTPGNYERFVTLVAGEVTLLLEKAVLKSTFSRLGGLQFDKELRSLTSFLTSVTTWSIRDKFSRVSQ